MGDLECFGEVRVHFFGCAFWSFYGGDVVSWWP